MKAIVCVTNNVVSDGRVKRVIKTASEVTDQTDVICFPIPNNEFGIDLPNVKPFFVDVDLNNSTVFEEYKKCLEDLEIKNDLLKVCPFLGKEVYYSDTLGKTYEDWLKIRIGGSRWKEIRSHIPEETGYADGMSYITVALVRMVMMAKEVSNHPADVIYCNDLDTLLCGVIHKRKYGSRLIYDIHDFAYDISPGVFPRLYSYMLALLENTFIKEADELISLAPAILSWIKRFHGVNTHSIAIPNSVELYRREGIKVKHFDEKRPLRVYFHGLANKARNLHLLIDAAKDVDEIELVIRTGENDYVSQLREQIKYLGIEKRVKIVDMVSYDEAIKAANMDGDIGIYASSPNNCLNWKYAYTVKFFEYLAAGLPIITADAVNQSAIVKKYDCGFILNDCSVNSIKAAYREVLKKRNELEKKSENSLRATEEVLNWEIHEQTLKNAFVANNMNKSSNNSVVTLNECIWQIQDFINKIKGIKLERKLLEYG